MQLPVQPQKGAPIHIIYPLEDDVSRATLAQVAATTRISIRSIFPDRSKYLQAFSVLKPDSVIAAFSGEVVIGFVLIKRDRADAFEISRAEFMRLWGRVWGTWLWWRYHLVQAIVDAPGVFCAAVWVHPDWRSRGIGRKLYQRLLDETDGEVQALARNRAVSFHRQLGFTPTGNLLRRAICYLMGGVAMRAPRRALRETHHGGHHAHP